MVSSCEDHLQVTVGTGGFILGYNGRHWYSCDLTYHNFAWIVHHNMKWHYNNDSSVRLAWIWDTGWNVVAIFGLFLSDEGDSWPKGSELKNSVIPQQWWHPLACFVLVLTPPVEMSPARGYLQGYHQGRKAISTLRPLTMLVQSRPTLEWCS